LHDPVSHFIAECARLQSTTAEVDAIGAVPAEVARYVSANRLDPRCVGWREFAPLDWGAAGIGFDDRPAHGDDLIGLTGCHCGIGETGTVLLLGAPATPKATALLPETHICVVKRSRIVATMEDAFALMRSEIGEPPRATFLVSGPSRTADIEQTLVIGAHGPYRVHVILIP
jgi:L-lactate dehydrogenase complex protein LldG